MRRRGRRVSLPPLSRRLYHRTLDSRVYVTGEPVRYNVGRHFNRWPLLFFTSNFPFVVPRNSRHVASRHYSHGKSGTATQINDRRFKGKLIRTSRVPRKPRHRLSLSLSWRRLRSRFRAERYSAKRRLNTTLRIHRLFSKRSWLGNYATNDYTDSEEGTGREKNERFSNAMSDRNGTMTGKSN